MTQIEAKPVPPQIPQPLEPAFSLRSPDCRLYVGDCRDLLARLPEVQRGEVDLVFADPPFNWNRAYDQWDDRMKESEYLTFTYDWIDLCVKALKRSGTLVINIPDDWAAEITAYLKGRMSRRPPEEMWMVNWCIWHYRFGQNQSGAFINSKVHVLYFCKDPARRTWRPERILEPSDRATTYFDPRTQSKKDGMPPGMRVPLDVWYGKYWGRIQGNNKERRAKHDNQLPEAYLERVILSSSEEGDLVLDPFTGSGTTAVMARHYKRRFIGTEFSKANAASAFERIQMGPHQPGKALNQATAIFAPRTTRPASPATPSAPAAPRRKRSRSGN